MAIEKLFILGHLFDSHSPFARLKFYDLVDEGEWISMRKKRVNFLSGMNRGYRASQSRDCCTTQKGGFALFGFALFGNGLFVKLS